MAKSKFWKLFESRIGYILDDLASVEPMFVHRFTDSRAARNFVKKQPADYMVAFRGTTFLLEVKTSTEDVSLANNLSGLMGKDQAANHRLWSRSMQGSVIAFRSKATGRCELWDGVYVAECRAKGTPLQKDMATVCEYNDLEDALLQFLSRRIMG